MDLSRIAEEKIREGMENGEFDRLEGRGSKIDLSEYFNTPSEFRAGYSVLKANKFVPGEVELLREIAELSTPQDGEGPTAASDRERRLNEKRTSLAILLERNHRGSRRR